VLQLLSAISETVTEQVASVSSIIEHCESIRRHFESPGLHVLFTSMILMN